MTDRPMIFSAAMVLALLDGRKSQTRRVLNPQPNMLNGGRPLNNGRGSYSTEGGWKRLRYAAADRLWVRETWTARMTHGWTIADARSRMYQEEILFQADGHESIDGWWPSIHMPREFSRLTLIVKDVRVQRLQEISEWDAREEGVTLPENHTAYREPHKLAYASLWDILNAKKPGCAWADNPWVAALTFRVIKENIDGINE